MLRKVEYAKPAILCHPTKKRPVPKYFVGCSNCGCVWDFFYNTCGYMGPPNYCPRCGAMNTCRSEQQPIEWPDGAISISEDGG